MAGESAGDLVGCWKGLRGLVTMASEERSQACFSLQGGVVGLVNERASVDRQ